MRRRYVYDPDLKEMVELALNSQFQVVAPAVFSDLPGYESPATGKWVEGKRARREDLKRSGCRPYEGREQESKEANRYKAEAERRVDSRAEEAAHRAWAEAPERVRKHLRYK